MIVITTKPAAPAQTPSDIDLALSRTLRQALERHAARRADVTLYESDARLGGHAARRNQRHHKARASIIIILKTIL